MAKNTIKRSIAMLLVLNMLTGMIPVQALADEGETGTTNVVITIEPSSEKTESAPAEKQESAPAEKTESAPAEKQESAPAEKTESAPAEKTEAAPAEKTESAPAEKTESAPVETASAEVASYQAESSGEESSDKDVKNEVIDVETSSGKTEKVEVEVTTEKTENEDGSETVKTEVVVENFKTESGALVDFIGVGDMTTDEEGTTRGNVHEEYLVVKGRPNGDVYIAEGGYELTLEDKEIGEDVTVDVPLTDEEGQNENTEFGGPEAGEVIESTGDHPESETDGEYDYTDTTVTEQGSVTITTTEIEITEEIDIENTDMDHVVSDTTPTDSNDLVYVGQANEMYLPGYEGEIVLPEGSLKDDYAYTYVGSGNTSKFMPAIVFTTPLDEAGKLAQYGENAYIGASYRDYYVGRLPAEVKATIAYDENGKYVTDENGYILDVNGNRIFKEEHTAVGPDGNTVYLHRFDNPYAGLKVEGWYEDGEWVEELNGDKSYYAVWAGPQQFILVDDNGNLVTTYCADANTPTQDNFGYNVENLEDATYYSEEEAHQIRAIAENGYWGTAEGFGSIEEMKAKLAEAGFTEEELASLNDGVALTATQMAIWSCSNKMSGIDFINSHYSNWGVGNVPKGKEDEVELLFKLYDYLMSLEPSEVEGTTADTIINAKNFVDDMNVTVIEKVKDHENNKDDDRNNDAYVTNLTFALVVEPSTENGDDLVVKVVGSDGSVIASGRIAGEMTEEDKANDMVQLEKGEDNNYTFSGITMVEGEHNFKLTLEGIQNLKEGVYLYSSEVKEDTSSQTLVGVSSGERAVSVEMNITFELDVKETVVARERVWRTETTHEDPPPPAEYRLGFGVGQLEVIEEEVPLAAPPQTGDMSILWFAMIALSGCGLCILNLLEKRKCRA